MKTLQEQLEGVKKSLTDIRDQNDKLIGDKALLNNDYKETETRCSDNSNALVLMDSVDVEEFETKNPDLLLVGLADLKPRLQLMQNEISDKINTKQREKYNKESDCGNKISKFKNPSEEITTKFRDWRSDVNSLPDSIEFVSEYQRFLKRLNEEDLPGFEKRFNKYLHDTLTNQISVFRRYFIDWESSINKTIEQLNSYLKDIDFDVNPETYIQLASPDFVTQKTYIL